MTRGEIISGLEFTVAMFLFDPSTGETYTEPRNDMDKTTIDACKGAIELLKREPFINKPCISKGACQHYTEDVLDKIKAEIERQEKWLLQAGCTAYNVDIAFDAIKSAVGRGDEE